MNETDETIDIECSECPGVLQGFHSMVNHILTHHLEYSKLEARYAAQRWMEYAYRREKEFEMSYHQQRKEDPSV